MIDIDASRALKNEGTTFAYDYNAVPDFGSDISFAEPLRLHAEYYAISGEVSVKGWFQTTLNETCDRCLSKMLLPLECGFDEMFFREGTQQDENYAYHGELVPLDKMVYDLIILNLPHRLLCKEDCKGLCPKCGQNLNEKQCDCKQEDTDETNPFAKLKGLF
ncbi:MAG: DUF177 domain-containing protein [Christensenella sp.]|nr:DUF177 domain-containing protein [Christensenella sp.]